ncbi:HpcH/HpaI aldolase/citrate lyase family protein [Nocardioides sp. L-11A]|uniref:HpcH/HpaI aldolase family protein n=1 Tax=Nocardioides sp. L-11A TaxID=3043848 RepID=UPI00249C613A|nr:aldolase/citrate lyase family protein [Nocardioides sp. L-11A]
MNRLREKLAAGEVVYSCYGMLVEPVWADLVGAAGFDMLVLDCEEVAGDNYGAGIDHLVRATQAAGISSCVRVVENIPGAINRALNTGTNGIFVPHVRSAAEARSVVEAARYAPVGLRGAAPVVRGAGYGTRDWPDYYADAEDSLVFIMVEDTEGVDNIEEIVKVPGIDGVMVGTWDLAVELGRAQIGPTHPEVSAHVDRVIDATVGAGLAMAAQAWSPEATATYASRGCQLLFVSLDSLFLINGMKSVRSLADDLEGHLEP